jgi:hypothetical protein
VHVPFRGAEKHRNSEKQAPQKNMNPKSAKFHALDLKMTKYSISKAF